MPLKKIKLKFRLWLLPVHLRDRAVITLIDYGIAFPDKKLYTAVR